MRPFESACSTDPAPRKRRPFWVADLLFGYGALLNFAPVPFERVVGLYLATLFCVWQVVSFVTFRSLPSGPHHDRGTADRGRRFGRHLLAAVNRIRPLEPVARMSAAICGV